MILLEKNLKFISRLNIHYYPNGRYKCSITSLKAVIVGKSLTSTGLDIDRILHFVFLIKYSKFTEDIGSGKFTDTFCQNTNKFQKSEEGGCYIPTNLLPSLDTPLVTTAVRIELVSSLTTTEIIKSFKRLISSRDKPEIVYFDNDKTFNVGAKWLANIIKD